MASDGQLLITQAFVRIGIRYGRRLQGKNKEIEVQVEGGGKVN